MVEGETGGAGFSKLWKPYKVVETLHEKKEDKIKDMVFTYQGQGLTQELTEGKGRETKRGCFTCAG